jgi:hypothetical protein
MPNQKISELTAIVTVDNSVDVLPIVDISANTTKKVTPNALKTALALDNVNNTSDANKPVSIAQQDALNAKVDENAPITAGTAAKITFDAKGLVTSGDSLDETDLPTGINANKIGTGVVSTTEFEYLNGVTSAIQTQINSKQATLVSGTNIKTINGATVLGAGDITIAGNPPSGVAGAIQFSNGSAFASDAANLFWDDTNNRLGIGTNAPTEALEVVGQGRFSDNILFSTDFKHIGRDLNNSSISFSSINSRILAKISTGGSFEVYNSASGTSRFAVSNGGQTTISGGGSTSATTSLLVQNSAGTHSMSVRDNGSSVFGPQSAVEISNIISVSAQSGNQNLIQSFGGVTSGTTFRGGLDTSNVNFEANTNGGVFRSSGTTAQNASSVLDLQSTTRGFLPPRMTTTQKNAIASPAAGLVVYDSTTNKLQCYNGSTWNDLF